MLADRLSEDDDWARRELLAAHQAGATIVPVPPIAVCLYTSLGNLAHVRALGPADGDGVQVAVTVWQTA